MYTTKVIFREKTVTMDKEACDIPILNCRYIIRKDDSSKDVLLNDTNFYHQKYGDFAYSLECGLNIPLGSCAQ